VVSGAVPGGDLKEKLRQRLAFERGQARLKEILAELEKQAKIEVDEAALVGIK